MSEFGVTPARLSVGLVSAGRVGTAVGQALERSGHVVSGLVARSQRSRDLAARRLPEAALGTPEGVAARSELLVLAVPDPELPAVVSSLVGADAIRPGHIVLHTAGALGWSVLRPCAELGAVVVAAHPAMTFTGADTDIERLAGCGWGISAPDEIALTVGQMLVLEMGGRPVTVAESMRGLYHAALAHGANHLVTLVNDAMEALAAALRQPGGAHLSYSQEGGDIPLDPACLDPAAPNPPALDPADSDPDGNAPRLLAPLLHAALDNALSAGDAALTGPVMRGDAVTVSRHLDVLEDLSPDLAAGYRALALRTAQRSGSDRDLKDLLAPDLTEHLR